MSSDLAPGQVVAERYRLERALGEGGMGVVWAATRTDDGASLALKFLKATGRSSARRRFMREARALTGLDHPNVVRVHDVLEHDALPVIVMDLLDGETLRALLERDGALSLPVAAAMFVEIVDAVRAAHDAGIIHRDLKPENVFLAKHDGAPHALVLDFGLAKLSRAKPDPMISDTVTAEGTMVGTPWYMAPEQSLGGVADRRVDIWALGVMLYEALSGARPVEGDDRREVLQRLLTEGISPLDVVVPEIPRDVSELVAKMLHRTAERRLDDLTTVRSLLENYASHA